MLSIEECRKLIPNHEEYTDKQAEEIRDNMRVLAELTFESWVKEKNTKLDKNQ
ncbi:MAG: hypothetical protein WBO66_00520 [Candidatus Moraniibacteriota bacterium]